MTQFESYGNMAKAELSSTRQNGRYSVQRDAEKFVPEDIIQKLKIESQDSFLDIGCGMGLNLLPISQLVNTACGCDHPNVIEKLKKVSNTENIDFFTGDFTTHSFENNFTKILIYSVLHTLPNEEFLFSFIDKALSVLNPAGRMLLGDIPNTNKKERFLSSNKGAVFQKEWEDLCVAEPEKYDISRFQTDDFSQSVTFDDKLVMRLIHYIRNKGFHAYISEQPSVLPFGNTREDIIVVGAEY